MVCSRRIGGGAEPYMELPRRQVKCTPYAFAPTTFDHSQSSDDDTDSSDDDDSEYDDNVGDLKPASRDRPPQSGGAGQSVVPQGKIGNVKCISNTKTAELTRPNQGMT